MSIYIDKITRGRFGNKILQYNSLCQIANNKNLIPYCNYWEDSKYFKKTLPYKAGLKPVKILFCKKIIENDVLDFNNFSYKLDDPAYCLHNVFYNVTKTDPRVFLELKDIYKPKFDKNIIQIGIHIRGDDIISKDGNNGREIHESKYYIDSINYILNNLVSNNNYVFHICTDDITFKTYKEVLGYLLIHKYNFKLGPSTNKGKEFIYDFGVLSECDILINSSSTFCVTAGFLGKKNKKIIHSKKWIDKNINHTSWNNKEEGKVLEYTVIEFRKTFDNFWINTLNNDNNYYKLHKII